MSEQRVADVLDTLDGWDGLVHLARYHDDALVAVLGNQAAICVSLGTAPESYSHRRWSAKYSETTCPGCSALYRRRVDDQVRESRAAQFELQQAALRDPRYQAAK